MLYVITGFRLCRVCDKESKRGYEGLWALGIYEGLLLCVLRISSKPKPKVKL